MANTTYGELIRLVMINLQPRTDGIARLAVEQAINDAQKVIACAKDFDELMVLDTTNAATVDGTKLYNIETDFGLSRPKDIYSIRLMDEERSRKLTYVPFRELDRVIPYTEMISEGRSNFYTVRGKNVELYPIPDDAYDLYIQHSQWPLVLTDETDETSFVNIDYAIVALASDMALASLEGGGSDWMQRATQLLGVGISEEDRRPDQFYCAQPFRPLGDARMGEYWNNPWVKKQPQ